MTDDDNLTRRSAEPPALTPTVSRPPPDLEIALAREQVRAGVFPRLAAPYTIGRYQILRRVGSGGMGLVLAANDPQLEREVAIKVVRQEGIASGEAQARLLREARAIARLQHPNVVAVYDAGMHEGLVYIAMELVDGCSLGDWLETPRSWFEIVEVMLQAGEGLSAAHEVDLVHRDFKPANVLIGHDGRARVADFGLARVGDAADAPARTLRSPELADTAITTTGAVAGTPAYMAPEQLEGRAVGARTDQFAFAVTLFEALFGRRPFVGDTLEAQQRALLHDPLHFPPAARAAPARLCALLARALARDPESRFSALDELLTGLRAVLGELPKTPSVPAASPIGEQQLPSVLGYLSRLPAGLDSHHDCMVTTSLLRLVLRTYPLDEDRLLSDLSPILSQVTAPMAPVVHVRALLSAVYEEHFATLEDWAQSIQPLVRAGLSTHFIGFFVVSTDRTVLAKSAARVWTLCHRGLTMRVFTSTHERAELEVRHPAHLFDRLARVEALACLRWALSMAGGADFELTLDAAAAERLSVAIRWEASR